METEKIDLTVAHVAKKDRPPIVWAALMLLENTEKINVQLGNTSN